jgi:selenide,water dikinase
MFDPADYPDLLVGLGEPDDAAVWRLDDTRALVATTDFFTPVVDDPYDYGSIAAANALSDVYAMGGEPFLALNIAALPPNLPTEISAEILRGGAEKVREAGVVLAGGHTVQDNEPKFGLIVLGFVHPARILSKGGARPGDRLVLTKPLGFGTVTTALKREQVDPADLAEAVSWMKRLNKTAAELAAEFELRGGTDVTGFSLLGHASELANASNVRLRFSFDKIRFTRGAQGYAQRWIFPGGSMDNRLYYGSQVHFAPEIDEASQMLLFDAQTSGGLLLCVPEDKLPAFTRRAAQIYQPVWVVGEVLAGQGLQVI